MVAEAGAVTVGGHTIDDKEPKFGLSVMGVVHPDKVVRNIGALRGDVLFLTKPIGTGVLATAIKQGLETEASARHVIESMAALNRLAAEAMIEVGVHACTDVTGFGLLGHLHEMAEGSGVSAWLSAANVPVFDRALDYAADGVIPGRTNDLLEWARDFVTWLAEEDAATWLRVLLDPQTSGGLLIAVAAERADALASALSIRGVLAAQVGGISAGEAGRISVR
jgi:selenide,water dikinase